MSPGSASFHEEWSAGHRKTVRTGGGGANRRQVQVTSAKEENRGPESGSGYWRYGNGMALPGIPGHRSETGVGLDATEATEALRWLKHES